MSETNGHDANAEGMSRILTLNGPRGPKHALTRAQRAEVEKIAHDMVIQECAKVHEFYMEQIPTFMANMIVDAMVDRGLIPEFRTGPVATPEAPVDAAESPETRESIPASAELPDSITPPSAGNVPADSEGPEAA